MDDAPRTAETVPNTRAPTTRGPVAVGTDGSDGAAAAVRWAADEARARGVPLVVVHATDVDSVRGMPAEVVEDVLGKGQRCLRQTLRDLRDGRGDLRIETVLSRGAPADSVLEAAGAHGTAVVGSRGLGGFSALLLGSCGLRAAARARVPLVVVPRGAARSGSGPVVAAVKDDGDRPVLRHAAESALCHGADVRAVSVWMFLESVGSMAPLVDDIGAVAAAEEAATRRVVEPVRRQFPGVRIDEQVVRSRSVAGTLVRASEDARLVVVGARRPTRPALSAFGGVTHALLHHAQCPIALVPHV